VTLVLIHSAGATPALWNRVRAHLAGVPVFVPALPGRDGVGPMVDEVADHGRSVLDAIDAERLGRVVVAGHSLGGAVALWLTLTHPERIAGLAIANSGARMRVSPQVLDALPGGLSEIAEAMALSNFPAGAPNEWVEERKAEYLAVGGEVVRADLAACDRFDVLDRLWEIRCRTQVLAGSEDLLTPPRHARQLAERVSAARYSEYAGAGHMLPYERAAEVAGELAVLWAASIDGRSGGGGVTPGREAPARSLRSGSFPPVG